MKNALRIVALFLVVLPMWACGSRPPTSDQKQQAAQEKILAEGTAQTGMPAIIHFRERKLMKLILEMRDQDGLATYSYTFSEMTGKYSFFCDSIGYGLPYSTQYTSPSKIERSATNVGYAIMPQADPNGLFSPASAEGTWVMCKDPNSKDVLPIYVEPRVIVSPFKLP